MAYNSEDSSDEESITHPTQVYQRIYEKEADDHFQERMELERESEKLDQEYQELISKYGGEPGPVSTAKLDELDERMQDISERLDEANERWINSYSVAMYYKDKERRDLEEDSD